jgi:hypothetical protein
LEERLRRASERELELENHIAQLYGDLKRKEEIILAKNEVIMAEVASSSMMNKIRKNIEANRAKIGDLDKLILDGVNFTDVGSFDIRADQLTRDGAGSRNRGYQNLPATQKYKAQLVQLFREF